jgi:hypothetical protein
MFLEASTTRTLRLGWGGDSKFEVNFRAGVFKWKGWDDWAWGVEGHAMTLLVFRLSELVIGNGLHLRVSSKAILR